jgi:hypothetical protein
MEAATTSDGVMAAARAFSDVSFVPKSSTHAAISFVPNMLPYHTRAHDLGRNGARLDMQ